MPSQEQGSRELPKEILLGEDNPGDVYIVRSSLADSNLEHNFYHVNNGKEIISYLHQEGGYRDVPLPDLILLDLNLPLMSGFEVLKEIKSDYRLRIIPVIIISSSDAPRDIVLSYQLHANSYIVKPSDYISFFMAIKKLESFWLNLVKLPPIDDLNPT